MVFYKLWYSFFSFSIDTYDPQGEYVIYALSITYSYLDGKHTNQKTVVALGLFAFLAENRVPAFYESCPMFFESVSPFFMSLLFCACPADFVHTAAFARHAAFGGHFAPSW